MCPIGRPRKQRKVFVVLFLEFSPVVYTCKTLLKLLFCLQTFLAAAQHACSLRLGRNCWSKWRNALNQRLTEEIRLQAASHLAVRSTQRRALEHWKACILTFTWP